MNPASRTTRLDGSGLAARIVSLTLLAFAALPASGEELVAFSKLFQPATIGPGSVSMLVFEIGNFSGEPVSSIAFVDNLPLALTLAAPAFVSNDCGGTLSAPAGGGTVSLSDGVLGVDATCQIVVNVTASTAGTHTNVTGDLTSSAGNSGTASADLTVDVGRPGFSKGFDPSMVAFGGRSTLTFLIDNSANSKKVVLLSFTDNLPPGMVVADPADAGTDCGTAPLVPTLTADAGSSSISFSYFGTSGLPAVAGFATCSVNVDVIAGSAGSLGNVSEELIGDSDASSGKAAAVLEVTGFVDPLSLEKEFTDDPVPPGGTVTLEFTLTNRDRDEAATNLAFDDDLEATLSGLTAAVPGTPDPPCGPLSSLSFSPAGVLTLTGGELGPEGTCTFSVELTVPGSAVPGAYPNAAGPVTGDVGGSPVEGNTAGDLLFVVAPPPLTMTKEFTDDPVGPGGSVTLSFTITNFNTASGVTDLEFTDDLNSAIVGLAANGLVAAGGLDPEPILDLCGSGSELTIFDLNNEGFPSPPFPNFPPDPTMLIFTGGNLAVAGMPDDSCTFEVVLDVPVGVAGGVYTNTSSEVTEEFTGPGAVTADPASGDLVVLGSPRLTKQFTDDPVPPSGGAVTLELTLSYDVEAENPDALAIAFTDDLAAVLPGTPDLTAASVDSNTCSGSTVDISTPTLIDFSGGTLTPGESCTVILTVTVPAGSPVGFHTNSTSDVTSTVGGVTATGSPAEDDLLITPLVFTKEFLGDPVIAGDALTLRFTITNNGTSSTEDATGIEFDDSLTTALAGLAATGPPSVNSCGGTLSGTTDLSYTGGSLTFGSTCTIEVEVLVPGMTADGDYLNVTSSLMATIDSTVVTIPPAVDTLIVDSGLLTLAKEFTDDPVKPGDPVSLEFTLENLSATETITDIGFDDDLDAALSGLAASGPPSFDDCGGTLTGTGMLSYSGGTLGPDASCTIVVPLLVPGAPLGSTPPFINTTSNVTGKVGALDVFGIAASDELLVQLLTLSKQFTDDPTTATGTVTLEFTITNLDTAAVSDLAFSDDLAAVIAGLEATTLPPVGICGPGSAVTGTSFLAFTGGSLPASSFCVIPVTLTVPGTATAGSFLNSTSDLFQFGLPVAAAATDFLDIEPPPDFSKSFTPDAIFDFEVSTLTFTIDNTASALDATGLDFTDVLPVPVVVATPSGATTDCTGGVLTEVEGSGTISYTGGSVAAGTSCTISVDVASDTAGVYVNETGDLTSSTGNSGTAADTLTVEALEADLELSKEDLVEPVMLGRYQVYELTVTNLGPDDALDVVLEDGLPPGTELVVAEPTALCGETAGLLTCDLGDLASGASATVVVHLYVELDATSPLDNLATVSSNASDPDLGNNDVMESTEVIGMADVAVLDDVDDNGFPEVAVPLLATIDLLVKDVETEMVVHQTEVFPDGWVLADFAKVPGVGSGSDDVALLALETATGAAEVRVVQGVDGAPVSTASLPAGFAPVSMTVIPDDGSGRTLIAVASRRIVDGLFRILLFDAADGSSIGLVPVNPNVWPIDLAPIASFSGDALVELGVLWVNSTNGAKRIRTRELDGTLVGTLPLPTRLTPFALDRLLNCCGTPAQELATLGWDQLGDRVRVRVIDAASGGVVSDRNFAVGAAPAALRCIPTYAGSTADEIAALYRASTNRAAVRIRDAATGAQLLAGGFGPVSGSIPLGLDISPDSYGTSVDELAVYWQDLLSGARNVTLRDAGSSTIVRVVPIP